MSQQQKPIASLSLDLDNKWSYMKTHGDAGWEQFPSYLNIVVPRVLDFLAARELAVTFFIVGQDAALDENREAIASLAAANDGRHEIGNHSFRHEPWFHLYTENEIETELARAEEHIERVTGRRPRGFRGPGFSFSSDTLRVLERRGYEYDASTFPTFFGPLARAYYFMTTRLSREEMRERNNLFGTLRDGFRPLKPYRWQVGAGELVEMPVTTMPLLKTPIHVSYLLYLSSFSPALAVSYFKMALALCRLTRTAPSLLLHPLDFLGCDDIQELSFFPGMNMPGARKLHVVSEALRVYAEHFTVMTVGQHVREALRTAHLPVRSMEIAQPDSQLAVSG